MASYFPSYGVEVASAALDVVVLWNDWPVHASRDPARMQTTSVRLNPMVLEGTNVLSVRARIPERPVPAAPHLDVRVFRMLAEDDLVFFFRHFLRPQHTRLAKDGWTEVARHEIELARTFGRWAWEDGAPYMDADRDGVLAALSDLHAAFARGDYAGFVSRMALKLEELARSTGRPTELVRDEQVRMLTKLAELGFVVEPLDLSRIELASSAGGRLVTATREGRAPLWATLGGPDGPPHPFQVTFGRVGGRWVPVR